jgi:hypothetical protein
MMTMYSAGIEDMTQNCNVVKEHLLYALERDGLLKEDAEEIAKKYVVVIHKRGYVPVIFESWVQVHVPSFKFLLGWNHFIFFFFLQ